MFSMKFFIRLLLLIFIELFTVISFESKMFSLGVVECLILLFNLFQLRNTLANFCLQTKMFTDKETTSN